MKVARAVARIFAVAGVMVLIWPSGSKAQTPSANVSVFATGLNNPRGSKFGPDGELYVAEGGAGGTASTVGQCEQVPAPVGPYTGGFTSRISKIDRHGNVSTVIDNLPSSESSAAEGNLVMGVADVAFIGDDMYAITAGSGCSHGLAHTDNGVFRVFPDGKWKMIADLSAFQKANPVAHPNPPDFEPDGTWYSMVSVRGNLYAVTEIFLWKIWGCFRSWMALRRF